MFYKNSAQNRHFVREAAYILSAGLSKRDSIPIYFYTDPKEDINKTCKYKVRADFLQPPRSIKHWLQ